MGKQDKTENKVYTLGPIIHNKHVVEDLKSKGIFPIKEDDIPYLKAGDTVIIRAHGISPQIIKKLHKIDVNIIDGTCPLVKKVQKNAQKLEKEGYQVVIIGDENHPEVKAILDSIHQGIVIDPEQIPEDFHSEHKLGLLAQTTERQENFQKVVDFLSKRNHIIRTINTICNATISRQQDAKELAKNVDFMIVIGDKHSSNTQKLFKLCSQIVPSVLIENKGDLDRLNFHPYNQIGITAGASTPDGLIHDIITTLIQS